jgi:hypothetical protein
MAKPIVVPVTISAGQSLSASADMSATTGSITALLAPSSLTVGPNGRLNVSFQFSDDNVTFYNLVDNNGAEFLRMVKAGTAVEIISHVAQGLYLKVRSGAAASPVVQSRDAVFKVVTN